LMGQLSDPLRGPFRGSTPLMAGLIAMEIHESARLIATVR
jgi:hypothetical protein